MLYIIHVTYMLYTYTYIKHGECIIYQFTKPTTTVLIHIFGAFFMSTPVTIFKRIWHSQGHKQRRNLGILTKDNVCSHFTILRTFKKYFQH